MALSRLTRGVAGGSFTRNTRFAFGHGCDHPGYVAPVYSRSVPQGQPYSSHALGIVTTNVSDALNRQVRTLFPDGTETGTAYDADGRRIAQTDQATNTTGFAYDGLGRLTAVTNALGKVDAVSV